MARGIMIGGVGFNSLWTLDNRRACADLRPVTRITRQSKRAARKPDGPDVLARTLAGGQS